MFFRKSAPTMPVNDRNDPQTWIQRAELEENSGQEQQAAATLFHVADLYARAGLRADAAAVLSRVLHLDPKHSGALRLGKHYGVSASGVDLAVGTGQYRLADGTQVGPRAGAEDRLAETLATAGITVTHTAGSTIARQGDPARSVHVVEHGQVDLLVRDRREARSIRVARLGRGAVFGDLDFLTGARRELTAVAVSDVELREVDEATMRELMARDRRLQEDLTQHGRKLLFSLLAVSLATTPPFSDLPTDARRALVQRLRFTRLDTEEVVIHRGECVDGLFFIASGRLEEYMPSVRPQPLRQLARGDIFNERSLFDPRPARASVRALEPAGVFVLPRAAVRELGDDIASRIELALRAS